MPLTRIAAIRLAVASLAVLAAPWVGRAMALEAPQPANAPAAAPAACPATPAALPVAYAAWPNATALTAASDVPGLAMATIAPGAAEALTLHPQDSVRPALASPRGGKPGTFAGMVRLRVARAGLYHVALGGPAWIDLVRDGKALASAGHGHGPACSGIRKIVDFALEPGDYVIQLDSAPTAALTMLVTAST